MEEPRPLALSVVVPAWNEAARLPATLDRLVDHLGERGEPYEVIVVSDGSDDGMDDVVAARGAEHLQLLRHERRRGKGAAVRTGMLAAKGERVLFTDADLATPIEDLTTLAAALEDGADVAIASRRLHESEITKDQGRLRRAMGRAFPGLVRAATGLPYADTQCGFKLFTQDAAKRLFEPLEDEGFAFDVEVLCRAREESLRVDEVPVHWESREGSKVSTVGDPLRMTGALLRLGGRTDLPAVIDHQLTRAAGWGTILVLGGVLLALVTRGSYPFHDLLAVALIPGLLYSIGRRSGHAGALVAFVGTATLLFVAAVMPPTPALLAAVLVHAAVSLYLGGARGVWGWVFFGLFGVTLHVGGLPLLLLTVLVLGLVVWYQRSWPRLRGLLTWGHVLFTLVVAAAVLIDADVRSRVLTGITVPPTLRWGDAPWIVLALSLLPLGWLPWTTLVLVPVGEAPSTDTRRTAALLGWAVLPVLFVLLFNGPLFGALAGLGAFALLLGPRVRRRALVGRHVIASATALLLAPIVALGVVGGKVAGRDGLPAALPWLLGGVAVVALTIAGPIRSRSLPLALLVLALATCLLLGTMPAAGWI